MKNEIKIYNQQNSLDAYEIISANSNQTDINFLKNTYRFEKIRDLSKKEGSQILISVMLIKIAMLSGIKNEINQNDAQDIIKMILRVFKTLSLEEIYKAFELERYGILGDKTGHYQLFNAEYVGFVLRKYQNWKIERKTSLNLESCQEKIALPEKSSLEKEKIIEKHLFLVFNDLKKTGFSDSSWLFFDELELSGKIKISKEKKISIYNSELKKYKKDYIAEEKKRRGVFAKHLIKDLKKEIENGSKIVAVQNKCKAIVVSEYLMPYLDDFETFKKQIKQ